MLILHDRAPKCSRALRVNNSFWFSGRSSNGAFFNLEDIDKFNSVLEKTGYHVLGEYGIAGRRYLWKESLKERFHIHCFQKESIFAHKHLLFRDYMNNYPNEAQKYANLKTSLAKQYPADIESYVNGKKDIPKKNINQKYQTATY